MNPNNSKQSKRAAAIGLLAIAAASGPLQATVSALGLVGYYDFDGDTLVDTSGSVGGSASANNGAWTGASTYKAGAFGRAVEVGDGAGSNFITATSGGAATDYDFGTGSFTVMYWINTQSNVASDPSIIAGGGKNWSGSGASTGWTSAIVGDDMDYNIGSGGPRGDAAVIDIDHDDYWAGQGQPGDHWNFVAMVVDRTGQTLTGYAADEWVTATSTTFSSGVSGQDFGQDSSTPTVDGDVSNVGDVTGGNSTIVIGQDGDLGGYSLPASGVDDLALWNRALTREELWEIYAEGRMNGNALGTFVVPEPSTGILALLGGSMLLRRRRKS